MPIRKARHDYVKLYRPPGTPYADGAGNWPGFLSEFAYSSTAIGFGIELAVNRALRAFEMEFGRPPRHDILVIEVATTHRGATARVYEIDPDKDNGEATNPTYAGAASRPSEDPAG